MIDRYRDESFHITPAEEVGVYVQARSHIGIVQRRSPAEAVSGHRRIGCDTRSCINGGAARGGAIKELALFKNSNRGTRSVCDLLHSLGNQFSRRRQIELQSLYKFLSFYDGGKIFREVGLESFGPQPIVVLLEHISGREELMKRSLVQQGLALRAGSSLGHESEYPASR